MSSGVSKLTRKMTPRNTARERTRVQNLRDAFQSLQTILPAVPPDTKLSKLDILILASAYIGHLGRLLNHANATCSFPLQSIDSGQVIFHPVKKWPMRTRLYAGLNSTTTGICPCYRQTEEKVVD